MPKTVLIADHNPLVRKVLCRILEVEERYDICLEAANGAEAVFLATKWKPDIIILDFPMRVMNGLEAARELKVIMPNVPIILFSQHGALLRQNADLNRDVDRIVPKGDAAALIKHVRELVPPIN